MENETTDYRVVHAYITSYDGLSFEQMAEEYQRVIHTEDTELIFVVTSFALFNAPHMYTGAHACWIIDAIKAFISKFRAEVAIYLIDRLIAFAYERREEPTVDEWFKMGKL